MLSETENVVHGSAELEEKTMMAVLFEMNNMMSELEENLNQLDSKISSLELEKTELNGKLKLTKEDNESLKKDKEELESSQEDLKKKVETEIQKKVQLEGHVNQLNSEISSLESEKIDWEKKLKLTKENNESLKKDKEELESSHEDLKKKVEIEIQQKTQLEENLNQRNRTIVSLEWGKTDLNTKLKLMKEEYESLKKDKEELESSHEDLKKKLEIEIQQKTQLEKNVNERDNKILSLESEKTALDKKLKLTADDNESLKKDKEELESSHEDLKKKLEIEIQQKTQLEENFNQLNIKIVSLESEKTDLGDKLKVTKEDNESLRKDKEELESSKENLKKKLEIEIQQLKENLNQLKSKMLSLEAGKTEWDGMIKQTQEDNESFMKDKEPESAKENVKERFEAEMVEESQAGNLSEELKRKDSLKSPFTSPVVTQKEKEIKKLQSELAKEKEYFVKMVEEKSKENSDFQMQFNDENQKRIEVEQELAKRNKEVEMLKEKLTLAEGSIYSNSFTSVGGNESIDEDHLEATLSLPAGKNIRRSGWNKHTVEVTSEKMIVYETENDKASNKPMLEVDIDKLFHVHAVTQEDVIRAKAKHIPRIFQLLYLDETETGDTVNQQLNNSQSEKSKNEEVIKCNNHEFVVVHFHMPTSCGTCNKSLSSVIRPRPALYCRLCHLKVHKDHHDKDESFCPPCKASTGKGSTKHVLLMASSEKEQQKWIDYLNKRILLNKQANVEPTNVSSIEID